MIRSKKLLALFIPFLLAGLTSVRAGDVGTASTLYATEYRTQDWSGTQQAYGIICPGSADDRGVGFIKNVNYGVRGYRVDYDYAQSAFQGYFKVGKGELADNLVTKTNNHEFSNMTIGNIIYRPMSSATTTWNIDPINAQDSNDKWMYTFNGLFSSPDFGGGTLAQDQRPFDLEIRVNWHSMSPPNPQPGRQVYHVVDQSDTPVLYSVSGTDYEVYFKAFNDKAKINSKFIPVTETTSITLDVKDIMKKARSAKNYIPNISGETNLIYAKRNQTSKSDYDVRGFVSGTEVYKGKGELRTINFSTQFYKQP